MAGNGVHLPASCRRKFLKGGIEMKLVFTILNARSNIEKKIKFKKTHGLPFKGFVYYWGER